MKKMIFEILMGVFAAIAVIFSVIDISTGLNRWQIIVVMLS
ncbi:MAG: hypothetical protein K0R15_576 [Clostridiales bacterium]|jgi:hypothetical protein|nr:hypothetical protein [Clostridiales bacterium]